MRKGIRYLSLGALVGVLAASLAIGGKAPIRASAYDAPAYSSKLPTAITLKDTAESDIRSYYSNLSSLEASERTGENLLKNLKPILSDGMLWYSYDNVWKIYEITDRDWVHSPAAEDTYGGFNAETNTYSKYEYGSSKSNSKNNPYVHAYYRDLSNQESWIRAWDDHNASGINREHIWCQSRGFKADSGAEGPAGTDVHHLAAADGYVNQTIHNDTPYGNVDRSHITKDAKDKKTWLAGNLLGLAKKASEASKEVFEPRDEDKGDIARACFYMVARYNNISGHETITQYEPNLTMVDYVPDVGTREDSSADHPVAMGILSDLLEWHHNDPVDEYELHRNNLIYENYQHNRNPFIDFPEWVDMIWGENKGTVSADPANDEIAKASASPVTPSDPGSSEAPVTPETPTEEAKKPNIVLIVIIAVVVVLVLIILIVIFTKGSKKQKKAAKKVIKSAMKGSSKKKRK